MELDILPIVRKVFEAKTVQITETNMAEVSDWCGGTLKEVEGGYLLRVTSTPPNPKSRQTTVGGVGDWVVYNGTDFKVYRDRSFVKTFDLV